MTAESVQLVVDGVPVAKGRARSTRAGHHYTPPKTREAEQRVVQEWVRVTRGTRAPYDGPVGISLFAFFPIPKSWPKKRTRAAKYHTTRPDLDNVLKLVKDALNGHAYVDDSAVVKIEATKSYTTGTGSMQVVLHFFPTEKGNE